MLAEPASDPVVDSVDAAATTVVFVFSMPFSMSSTVGCALVPRTFCRYSPSLLAELRRCGFCVRGGGVGRMVKRGSLVPGGGTNGKRRRTHGPRCQREVKAGTTQAQRRTRTAALVAVILKAYVPSSKSSDETCGSQGRATRCGSPQVRRRQRSGDRRQPAPRHARHCCAASPLRCCEKTCEAAAGGGRRRPCGHSCTPECLDHSSHPALPQEGCRRCCYRLRCGKKDYAALWRAGNCTPPSSVTAADGLL